MYTVIVICIFWIVFGYNTLSGSSKKNPQTKLSDCMGLYVYYIGKVT